MNKTLVQLWMMTVNSEATFYRLQHQQQFACNTSSPSCHGIHQITIIHRHNIVLPVTEIYLRLTSHPDPLNMAIPLWVGAMSTGEGLMATTRKETASSA